MAAIVFATTSYSVSESVSTTASPSHVAQCFSSRSGRASFSALVIRSASVFLGVSGYTSSSVSANASKSDLASTLRSVSAINSDCVSQRVDRCFGLHIPQCVGNTFNLYLWKSVSPRIEQCLSLNFVLFVETQKSFFSCKSVSFYFDQCLALTQVSVIGIVLVTTSVSVCVVVNFFLL